MHTHIYMIYVCLASHRYFFTGIIDTLSEIEILIRLDFVYECFIYYSLESRNQKKMRKIKKLYFNLVKQDKKNTRKKRKYVTQ